MVGSYPLYIHYVFSLAGVGIMALGTVDASLSRWTLHLVMVTKKYTGFVSHCIQATKTDVTTTKSLQIS